MGIHVPSDYASLREDELWEETGNGVQVCDTLMFIINVEECHSGNGRGTDVNDLEVRIVREVWSGKNNKERIVFGHKYCGSVVFSVVFGWL